MLYPREFYSAVPSRVNSFDLHTRADPGVHVRDSTSPFRFIGLGRVYRPTPLCPDGVHDRESTGTGSIVLNNDRSTRAASLGAPWPTTDICSFDYRA